ncbi:hypothetical protein FVEN_g4694 [Fusarium venenatum]|uniref:Uncharacterized protein n=1 Tax=Fusarium venenatum TaxID=56646 RepID=A0A2L2SYY8_9HYPO|nr:uncharacterized protein FVRRES_11454 [Fusarium venenatum]KAG8357470.1 hypothetical protein FVEN_g4694 [Fusarium venenatum]CEI38763.1 unnamed protein product [Fusarium venenatum]
MAQDIEENDADSSDADGFADSFDGEDTGNEGYHAIFEQLQHIQEAADANTAMMQNMADQSRARDEALDRREEARDRQNSLFQAQISRRLNKLESRLRRANEIGQGTTTPTQQV